MVNPKIQQLLSHVKAFVDHPLFYPRVFALIAKEKRKRRTKQSLVEQVIEEEYEELSRRLDRSQIQESCSVRNLLRSRELANLLIDDKGEINMSLFPHIVEHVKKYLYSFGPQRQFDAKRQEHILKVLQTIQDNPEIRRQFKKMSRPLSNKLMEDFIRQSLGLPANTPVTDVHTKRAVLSAWLCYLRQNVGSCFATAPAEIVHDEQPELFLQDLSNLLAKGQLKRTFGGMEYSVPLSMSWGKGDLKKPLLIQFVGQNIHPEIWFSPGLLEAFDSIGVFNQQETIKNKIIQLKNWLIPILHQKKSHFHSFIITNAEEILKNVMLHIYGLSEQDLKEYENRPKAMIQSQLLMGAPLASKSFGGMGEKCAYFFQQFEIAKNAFKSIADNALLKAWEFTLASFAETKFEFVRWNLYSSLGMGAQEPGGIGQCIYQVIQRKIDQLNRKVEEIQYQYEMAFTQLKIVESRIRQASTEKELQWLRVEYQGRANEFYLLEEQRDASQNQAKALVGLYDTLYQQYVELFKDYFQEVYDAEMQEVTTGPFDDSPAGFRLLYKHGRSNPSLWTRITGPADFVDSLASFFSSTETIIASQINKELIRDLSEVVTAIITHIRTKEFLETAFYRMAVTHKTAPIKDPLEHLEHIEKKPWAYTSGATMNTLVSCYFRLSDVPSEIAKWVENETELLVFLVDTLKQIPPKSIEAYSSQKRTSMLMQSPTHAFILKPLSEPFKQAWLNPEFTYTSVRDQLIRPAEQFLESLVLNEEMLQFLIQKLMEKVPDNFKPRFKSVFSHIEGPLNPIFFRGYVVDTMYHDKGLQQGRLPVLQEEEIDGLLYSLLPLFPTHELRERLKKIFMNLPGLTASEVEDILILFDELPISKGYRLFDAGELQEICKVLLCLSQFSTSSSVDYHLEISLAAQKLGLAMPRPIFFADTNWVKDEFGFVVSPGTGKLELWRLDYTGRIGFPMSIWKQWVDGSHPNQKWGVYVKPFEYGQI